MPSHNIKRTKKKISSNFKSKKTLKNININKIPNYNNSEEKKKSSKVGGNLDNIKLFFERHFPGLDAIIDKVPKDINNPDGGNMTDEEVIQGLLQLRSTHKKSIRNDLQESGLLEELGDESLKIIQNGGDGEGGDTQESILNNQSCDFVVNIKKLNNLEEIYGRGLYYIYRLDSKNNNKNILGLDHDTLYDKNSFFTRFCQSITHQEIKDQIGNAKLGRYFCIHNVVQSILNVVGSTTNPAKLVASGMGIIHHVLQLKEDKRLLNCSYQEAQRKMIKILYLCFAIDCKIFKLYKSRHNQELTEDGKMVIKEEVENIKITRISSIGGAKGMNDQEGNHKKYDQRKKEGILYLPPPLDKKFILSQFLSVISTGNLGDFVNNILNGDIYNYLLLQYVQFDTLVDTIRDAPSLQPGEFKLFTYDIYFDVLNIQHELCNLERILLKIVKKTEKLDKSDKKDYFELGGIGEIGSIENMISENPEQKKKKNKQFGDDKYFMKPNKLGYSQINFIYWLAYNYISKTGNKVEIKNKKAYIDGKKDAYQEILSNYEKYIIINDIKYIKYTLSKYMYNMRKDFIESENVNKHEWKYDEILKFGSEIEKDTERDVFQDIIDNIKIAYKERKFFSILEGENNKLENIFITKLEDHLIAYLDNYFCRLITMPEMRYHIQIIKDEGRENIGNLTVDNSRKYVENFFNYLIDKLNKDPSDFRRKTTEEDEKKTQRKIYQSQHKYGIPFYTIFRDNLMFYFLGISDDEVLHQKSRDDISKNNIVSFILFVNLFINYLHRAKIRFENSKVQYIGIKFKCKQNSDDMKKQLNSNKEVMIKLVEKYINELAQPETLLHIKKRDDNNYQITRSHDPIGNQTVKVINESESSNESKKFEYDAEGNMKIITSTASRTTLL